MSKLIIYRQELLERYHSYKNPDDKIARDLRGDAYYPVCKGVYEDNAETDGILLSGVVLSPSYLSFEYVLSLTGLIPERAYVYTSATTSQKHNHLYRNRFGVYSYTDVPQAVWSFGIHSVEENGYSYMIASKEKALCDLLYKKPPVISMKGLRQLLFEDLRIDEEEFNHLNKDDLLFLCGRYRKKNLRFLAKILLKER